MLAWLALGCWGAARKSYPLLSFRWVSFIPKCFNPALLSSTQESYALTVSVQEGAASSSFCLSVLVTPIPNPTSLAYAMESKCAESTGPPMPWLLCLTSSASLPKSPHTPTCLLQLSHPARFHSFLPSPVAPAIWWLSYDILCLYVWGS